MIVRIVKLSIDPNSEKGTSFRRLFLESKEHIAGQTGCHKVILLESQSHFFTHSTWDSEEALDNYRKSDLFGDVWPKTKALFYDKPEAWTCLMIEEA
ncbi:MAG TPA: antibiotic biosynthesis monooxygenase [Cryomorphaceae bacterium]|nr:antibiotic biosynthesis monooxygenase [Cryomorphaceae bacterium]HBB81068.1 antibiotic biosynthesis monooxygenase [Cryomorphaceae bacterium]HCY24759.1 antibiotic biosynthesis monooxygenase [Cryomorphaceae bacterium]|tara:strand:- start:484 stop:774 length:291 start_codon:yes stop_codon:yes gene_type:complete